MNLAQKEGGCLTRITIWKYSIIVKKLLGGGVERLTFPFFFHFMMIAYNKIYCLLPLPFSHKECQLNYFSFKCFPNIRFKSFEMIAFGTYCKIWSLSYNFVRFERQGPGLKHDNYALLQMLQNINILVTKSRAPGRSGVCLHF